MGKNKGGGGGRNAFYYFMLDFKDKQPRKFKSMQEVAAAAGIHWNNMTAEQKKPYEKMAKTEKDGQKVIKYTTTGKSIAVVQKQENDRIAKEQKMKDDIENTIRIGVETGRISDEMFYFAHVNYFCFCNADKRYYPAEIAIVRFTLREGVLPENVFHMIVKPGPLPLGYSFQAKQRSEETHQLPAPMGDDDENNLTLVTNLLMKFMMELHTNKQNMPPLYTNKKTKEVVENVLQNLCYDAGYDDDLFQVYSMEHLLYVLRNNVGEKIVWPTVSLSILELEKDIYDFCREIPCSYHENSDVPNHCSKSYVIRSAYIVCDNCCADLGIDLKPGQHVPLQAAIESSRAPSRASSVATNYKPSRRHQPFANKNNFTYLSARESEASDMSETSTVVDPNDYAALGGYDTEFSQPDTDGWELPKYKHKKDTHKRSDNLSQSSVNSVTSELVFQSTSDVSSTSQVERPIRRPATLSAGLAALSLSSTPGPSGSVPRVGRGRGRGIAANFSNK